MTHFGACYSYGSKEYNTLPNNLSETIYKITDLAIMFWPKSAVFLVKSQTTQRLLSSAKRWHECGSKFGNTIKRKNRRNHQRMLFLSCYA